MQNSQLPCGTNIHPANESRLVAVQDLGFRPASFFSYHQNRVRSTKKIGTTPEPDHPDSQANHRRLNARTRRRSRKEVFQPHLPVRLPCYDLAPITSFALGRSLRSRTSGTPGFHGLTGGVYKARERIHRAMADARLLANPASWGRFADPSPN